MGPGLGADLGFGSDDEKPRPVKRSGVFAAVVQDSAGSGAKTPAQAAKTAAVSGSGASALPPTAAKVPPPATSAIVQNEDPFELSGASSVKMPDLSGVGFGSDDGGGSDLDIDELLA